MKNKSYVTICIKIRSNSTRKSWFRLFWFGLSHLPKTILTIKFCFLCYATLSIYLSSSQVHANSMNIMFAQRITFRIDTHLYIYCSLAHTHPPLIAMSCTFHSLALFSFHFYTFFLFAIALKVNIVRTLPFVLNNGHIFITTISFHISPKNRRAVLLVLLTRRPYIYSEHMHMFARSNTLAHVVCVCVCGIGQMMMNETKCKYICRCLSWRANFVTLWMIIKVSPVRFGT